MLWGMLRRPTSCRRGDAQAATVSSAASPELAAKIETSAPTSKNRAVYFTRPRQGWACDIGAVVRLGTQARAFKTPDSDLENR